jgi:hypothetical protein
MTPMAISLSPGLLRAAQIPPLRQRRDTAQDGGNALRRLRFTTR